MPSPSCNPIVSSLPKHSIYHHKKNHSYSLSSLLSILTHYCTRINYYYDYECIAQLLDLIFYLYLYFYI